jgi:hypothetical protein
VTANNPSVLAKSPPADYSLPQLDPRFEPGPNAYHVEPFGTDAASCQVSDSSPQCSKSRIDAASEMRVRCGAFFAHAIDDTPRITRVL